MTKGVFIRSKENLKRLKKIGFQKGHKNSTGKKNPNWMGGNSKTYKLNQLRKIATRPKPEQCEVCGAFGKDSKIGICLDHNHETGEFRGWICHRCNVVLGMVKDKIEILELLIKYLKKDL